MLAAFLAGIAALLYFGLWFELLDKMHIRTSGVVIKIGWARAQRATSPTLTRLELQTVSTKTISLSESALTLTTFSSLIAAPSLASRRTPLTSTLPTAGTR